MCRFDKKYLIENGVVFRCNNESLAEKLMQHLHEFGFTWGDGESLLKKPHWDTYKKRTC
jgi:hypothetical protein